MFSLYFTNYVYEGAKMHKDPHCVNKQINVLNILAFFNAKYLKYIHKIQKKNAFINTT